MDTNGETSKRVSDNSNEVDNDVVSAGVDETVPESASQDSVSQDSADGRKRGNSLGVTSSMVATNVTVARMAAGMDLVDLSERLGSLGWPMSISSLSRLESGVRRIDVDDLVALAHALGTNPSALLFSDGPFRVATVSAARIAATGKGVGVTKQVLAEHDGDSLGTSLPAGLGAAEVSSWVRGGLSNFSADLRSLFWACRVVECRKEAASFREALNGLRDFDPMNDRAAWEKLTAARDGLRQAEAGIKEGLEFVERLSGEDLAWLEAGDSRGAVSQVSPDELVVSDAHADTEPVALGAVHGMRGRSPLTREELEGLAQGD